MISIIPFLLFFAFLPPTLIVFKDVFEHGEFEYAGYVIAIVSTIITTLMLSDPVGFMSLVFSFGVFPAIILILLSGFCIIPMGFFVIMLFIGLRYRVRFRTDHFDHEAQVHEQTQVTHNREGGIGISNVGRQQIARLVRAQKDDEEENDESGYVFISSDSDD